MPAPIESVLAVAGQRLNGGLKLRDGTFQIADSKQPFA